MPGGPAGKDACATAGVASGAGLAHKLVEQGVLAVMGGPDGNVVGPSDAGLGGFPKEFCVRVFGEFVETNVAAIDGHGVGIGGEGNNAGTIIKLDVADFNFFGEGSGPAFGIKGFNLEDIVAVVEDGASVTEEVGEVINVIHILEGAGPVFGDEKVITVGEAETFADVFETIAERPTDTDGFFGEGADL